MNPEEKILKFISNQLGIPLEELKPDSDLTLDLGIGPVELADLLTNLENKFAIKIPEEERLKIKTINQIINLNE